MHKVVSTDFCDRCGKEIASSYNNSWRKKIYIRKPFYKLFHDVPCWNRIDEFLLCDECSEEFNQWMRAKKMEEK